MKTGFKEFYDSTSHGYDSSHNNATTNYMRRVEDKIIRKHAKGLVLDIGCGTGSHLGLFENVVGVDISHGMVEEARKKTGKNVLQANAEDLPFSDAVFDSVVCMFGVLNMCDCTASVKEMHRVLKKGGTAIVSVTSTWDRFDKRIWEKARDVKSVQKAASIDGFSLVFNLFGRKDFITLFRENGFSKTDFHSLFTLQRPYWGLHRDFTLIEKMKLKADYIIPHRAGRVYIGVFRKR